MRITINQQLFEWDETKNDINRRKHKIDFEDAAKVFADEDRIERFDADHSSEEDRWLTIGKVREILFVVYTERGDITRLITARKATAAERREYEYACTEID